MGSTSSSRTPLPTSPRGKKKANQSAAPSTTSPYLSQGATRADAALNTTTPAPLQGPADPSPAFNIRLGRRGIPKRRRDESPELHSSPPRKQRRVAQASNPADPDASASSSAGPSAQPTTRAAMDAIPDASTKSDAGNTSLAEISTPSASVFSKEHASVSDSPNTSPGSFELLAEKKEDGAQTKHDIVENLDTQFRQFPTGEIAHSHPLQTRVLPQVRIKDAGIFNLPLDNQQLAEIHKYAYQPYAGKFGADWPFNSAHRLTSTIPPECLEIVNSEEWNSEVAQLATNSGMYLGFGQKSGNIEFKAGTLYLWDKDAIWRGYSR